MLRSAANPAEAVFITTNLTSYSIPAPASFYFFKQLSISNANAATVASESNTVKIGLQSMGYTKKSKRSKRSEGSGVKAISRGYFFFPFVRFLASCNVSSQGQASAVYTRCEVFILWKIVEV